MKVTVKKKQEEKVVVPFNEIPVGVVYAAEYHNGPVALKLGGGEAVLLSHGRIPDDEFSLDWFVVADGFKGQPATKILGKLTEIVVEEC